MVVPDRKENPNVSATFFCARGQMGVGLRDDGSTLFFFGRPAVWALCRFFFTFGRAVAVSLCFGWVSFLGCALACGSALCLGPRVFFFPYGRNTHFLIGWPLSSGRGLDRGIESTVMEISCVTALSKKKCTGSMEKKRRGNTNASERNEGSDALRRLCSGPLYGMRGATANVAPTDCGLVMTKPTPPP